MSRVIHLHGVNERGGASAAAVPDTPIAPRVLNYGTTVGHDGAAAIASPRSNRPIAGYTVSIIKYPFGGLLFWLC